MFKIIILVLFVVKCVLSVPIVNDNENKLKRQTLATIGIINGALGAESKMEDYLASLTAEFLDNVSKRSFEENMKKIEKIERQMERDKKAIAILNSSLDLARNSKSVQDYKSETKKMMKEVKKCEIISRCFKN